MAGLTKKDKEALMLFKEQLNEELPEQVKSIRLFGSKARGDATEESDVDVLVVVKQHEKESWDKVIQLASGIITETGVVISPKVFSEERIHERRRRRNVFMQMVDKESIPL